MTTPRTTLAVIPFSGFNNTWHDGELDRALESVFGDSNGNVIEGLQSRGFDAVNWTAAHNQYARGYAACFVREFEIKGAEFESMHSPREYNFTTDRIFITLPLAELRRIIKATAPTHMDAVCREEFTSRSGFISHYSPDWRTWGRADALDHNQIYAVLRAYVLTMRGGEPFDQSAEYDLMESWRGNGGADECLFAGASPALQRLDRIGAYLRQREERAYRWHDGGTQRAEVAA